MQFYPIRVAHQEALWALAQRAKIQLNYPPAYLEKALPQLKLSAMKIGEGWGEIAVANDKWVGYFFISPNPRDCLLEHLWVDPDYLGQGVEKTLLDRAIQSVRNGFMHDEIRVHSEPAHETFFLKHGFAKIGQAASKIEGGPIYPELRLSLK